MWNFAVFCVIIFEVQRGVNGLACTLTIALYVIKVASINFWGKWHDFTLIYKKSYSRNIPLYGVTVMSIKNLKSNLHCAVICLPRRWSSSIRGPHPLPTQWPAAIGWRPDWVTVVVVLTPASVRGVSFKICSCTYNFYTTSMDCTMHMHSMTINFRLHVFA